MFLSLAAAAKIVHIAGFSGAGSTGRGMLELLMPKPIPNSNPPAYTDPLNPSCLLLFSRVLSLPTAISSRRAELFLTTASAMTSVLLPNLPRESQLRQIAEYGTLGVLASSKDQRLAAQYFRRTLDLTEGLLAWGEGWTIASEDEKVAAEIIYELPKISQARLSFSMMQLQQGDDKRRKSTRLTSIQKGKGKEGKVRTVNPKTFNPYPPNDLAEQWKSQSTQLASFSSTDRSAQDDEEHAIIRTLPSSSSSSSKKAADPHFHLVSPAALAALSSIPKNLTLPSRLYPESSTSAPATSKAGLPASARPASYAAAVAPKVRQAHPQQDLVPRPEKKLPKTGTEKKVPKTGTLKPCEGIDCSNAVRSDFARYRPR